MSARFLDSSANHAQLLVVEDVGTVVVKVQGSVQAEILKRSVGNVEHEASVYERLKVLQGDLIPKVVYAGPLGFSFAADAPPLPQFGLITEFAGRSLREVLDSCASQRKRCDELLARAKATLKVLHELSLLHGDVRLDNFLVSSADRVQVIDFEQSSFCADKSAGELADMEAL